jgi:membrane-bound ClpP family serine protease
MNISDTLQSLGMLLVILGIIFISVFEDRLITYSFMGAGIILSVISLIMRRKKET